MKIWSGYGTEHSANLVMIGTFKEASKAVKVKDKIELLSEKVQQESGGQWESSPSNRFSDEMLKVLEGISFHSVRPEELEQLRYDFQVKVKDNQVHINTDEIEISALLKILIDNGARVEVYSAHDGPADSQ